MKPHMNSYAQQAQATILGVPRSMWRQFGIRAMPTLKAFNNGKECPQIRGRNGAGFKQSLDSCGSGGTSSPRPSPGPSPRPSPSPSMGGYKRLPGYYLGGLAAGDRTARDKAGSKARCDQLGSRCSGFTCNRGESHCTVRASNRPSRSPSGETSYLRPGATGGG
eukprot:gnl/MRDRNA2_/MRDRNA2_80106_c0_seq1.p1 gnl/MRDRNA2_/MRDRNA2_80106_c0~~gnl/MRDRNA2_/MRDRNA2_80106_c0_seq1.p1  ORF type:complete len:164 (+),score=16.76 gnl/MRDRNA2_/MRDRNA2_80106_c0_seq1:146-637(+)